VCGCIGVVVAALESGTVGSVAAAAVELTSALTSEEIEGEEQTRGSEVAAAMCGDVVAAGRAIVGEGREERGEGLLLGCNGGCRTEAAGNGAAGAALGGSDETSEACAETVGKCAAALEEAAESVGAEAALAAEEAAVNTVCACEGEEVEGSKGEGEEERGFEAQRAAASGATRFAVCAVADGVEGVEARCTRKRMAQ